MNCAIFCSLALCAFQIVFADKLAEDISDSIQGSLAPMLDANEKAYEHISAVADTVKSKEIRSEQISYKCTSMSTDAHKKFNKSVKYKKDKCLHCYHKAENTKDIQIAENCCKKIVEEFKKDAKSFMAQARTCIGEVAQKCAKSATDCRQEAADADKARDEDIKMMSKGPLNSKILR